MFCVIQEVNVRKASRGNPRSLEVYESCFLINGVEYRHYRFQKSRECFERPIKKAYRISIHKSYREQGKVKKKQVVICTVNYYDIVDGFSWFGDHVRGGLEAKAKALGLTEAELCEMVEEKLQPIIDRIEAEYKQTKEYAASQEHDRIIAEWGQKREAFAKEYGVDQDEYDSSRSYYENYHNNYSGESSYCGNSVNTYTENNRSVLKKFYRVLAKTFHPDSNPDADTSAEMKVLNQLKNDWGM